MKFDYLEEESRFHIVPAEFGTRLLRGCFDGTHIQIEVAEHVVAWRIESFLNPGGTISSGAYPTTYGGTEPLDYIGVQHADGSVTAGEKQFSSLNEFREAERARVVAVPEMAEEDDWASFVMDDDFGYSAAPSIKH